MAKKTEKTGDDLAKVIERKYETWKTNLEEWRKSAEEDYNFCASHQWSDGDRNKLEEEDRVLITFNRIATVIEAVKGLEANHRQQVQYLPMGLEDKELSENAAKLGKWVRNKGRHSEAESEAVEDLLICGMGWTEQRMEYEIDPYGRIVKDRVDPLEMFWDRAATKRNLLDAKEIIRAKKMKAEEILDRWPDAEIEADDDNETDSTSTRKIGDQYTEENAEDTQGNKRIDGLVVLHYQYYTREDYHRLVGQGGKPVFIKPQEYDAQFGDMPEDQRPKFVPMKRRVYKQAFVCEGKMLEESMLPCQTGFTWECMTGKRDHMKKQWFGLVRLAKDPQRWSNKFLSLILDIMASNAKGGLIMEEGAAADPDKFEEDWAKPNSVVRVNRNVLAENRIKDKPVPPYPQGIDRLMNIAIDSVRESMGVNMEMLGMADRVQAGVLENERKRSAYTILAPLFDSVKTYHETSGLTTLYMMKHYLPVTRMAQVLNLPVEQIQAFVDNADLENIDIIVDEAPDSPNNIEQVWVFIQQVAPWLLRAGVPIPPEIIEYSPLPATLVSAWKALLAQPKQTPPDPELQIKAGMAQADAEKKAADARLTDAKTNKTAMETAEIADRLGGGL